MTIKEQAAKMKLDSSKMAATSYDVRNQALTQIKQTLLEHKTEILAANQLDMAAAVEQQIPQSVLKRLKFTEEKLEDVCKGIENLIELPDPLNKLQFSRELDEGLTLYRQTCPIGVIGIIFEARPDALIQISCLCVKSGNCAILKGGSETKNTNKVLFDYIYQAALEAGLPDASLFQAEQRSEISELLECHQYVDLLIPRGSNQFVQYIMNHTKIPVMGHADGICHIYVDKDYDIDVAIPVILDAKTQYTAACNAVETLLVHKDALASLMPALQKAFTENQVLLKGTKEIQNVVSCEEAVEEDFATEYLEKIISAKSVENIDEAIQHINQYGSHHTDAIITTSDQAAEKFMSLVDSAGVYCNCSTRFADGYRYGFGAEVGISTSKLHARGPVGLDGLVTYKYKLYGTGHIVSDYAEGRKAFHFKDIN